MVESQRKLRLFCVACCRKVWDHLNEETRNAIIVAEKYADGNATFDELFAARDYEIVSHDVWGTFCTLIDYDIIHFVSAYVERCEPYPKGWTTPLWYHIIGKK